LKHLNNSSKKVPVNKPWITPSILQSIKQKQILYKKYLLTNSQEDLSNYKFYRNYLAKIMKYSENEYYKKLLNKNNHNCKDTWKILNSLIGKKQNNLPKIKELIFEDLLISDTKIIAEKANDFFSNVGSRINLPKNTLYHCKSNNLSQHSFYLTDTTPTEIFLLLKHSTKNSPLNLFSIPIKIIHFIAHIICFPLSELINKSFILGYFPSILKKSIIIPLFKDGSKSNLDNYRPISLLPFFSKIFEICLKNRLVNYFHKFKIITEHQFGFRKFHSTSDALLSLIYNAQKLLNLNYFCSFIFLDFKKAFDTISHNFLITKLYSYGIRGIPLQLLHAYLTDRSCQTLIEKDLSSPRIINLGVPQGSILGPLLFLVYINDFPDSILPSFSSLFADDSTILISGKTLIEHNAILTLTSYKISKWVSDNNMAINHSKSKIMHLNKNITSKLFIDNILIDSVTSYKSLGVLIDNKFNFKEHCNFTHNKICKLISLIYNIKDKLNFSNKFLLYYSLIQSILQYAIILYGNSSIQNIQKMQLIQRKALKILFNYHKRTHSKQLMKNLNIQTFENLHNQSVVAVCIKIFSNQEILPKFYNDLLNTYQSKSLSKPMNFTLPFSLYPNKDVIQKIFLKWNKIPQQLKLSFSTNTGRKALTTYLNTVTSA
jgi:hypothetical protein